MTAPTEGPTPAPTASMTTGQIRGSSLLLAGRFISIGVNFAVQVLTVNYLSQTAYGAFAYALSLVTLGETIVTFGLDRGVGRFLAVYDEKGDYGRLLGTLLMVAGTILSLGLALILLVIGLQGAIGGTIIDDPLAVSLLVILIVLAPIQALDTMLGSVLAVFASARAIFLRKYILGPGLRLAVVALLVLGGLGVEFLAAGYVATGAIGVALYAGILARVLRQRGILARFREGSVVVPAREILVFTLPLLSTDLVFIAMNTTDAIFLGHFWGTGEVAALRVIQPLAGMNLIVFSSFTLLYMPVASRMFARGDRAAIADLYWRTAIWVAVFSFPVFAVTTSLAGPVTEALYGVRYADSATYLALLAFGYYVNASLGFNGLTLRVFGFIRYTVAINLIAAAVNVALNLTLIPQHGALGAAVAATATMIIHNILKQAGLRRGTGIDVFDWRYLRVYVIVALAVATLGLVQVVVRPHVLVGLCLAAVASLVVLLTNRHLLRVGETFPEVLRLPLMRRILGA
ncbi:MAG: oligosaccharide flippase family protein [Chloroflexota bacterium]